MSALLECSDAELLHLAQSVYDLPSLAAWRAAELKALRHCAFASPVLEIGCHGLFSTLLLPRLDGRAEHVYRRVACTDARRLRFANGVFATVFVSCALEHIPDLPRMLTECRRVLRTGGSLIAAAPLNLMQLHLRPRKIWYARWRAGQLQQHHLLDENTWVEALHQAGFTSVQAAPFLSARMCELWDRVDAPLSIGAGRFTLAHAYRLGYRLLPAAGRSKLNSQWQRYFVKALRTNPSERTYAALFQASAPPDASTPPPAT
jgi:SAM-dependent methyltransferase